MLKHTQKEKVAIVSGRYPGTTFESAINHKVYALNHNYTYINCGWPGRNKNKYFNKLEYIYEYMNFFDYIFWIDDDAFFVDFERDLESLKLNGDQFIRFCSSPDYKSIWTYISSGQFMLKCNADGLSFIRAVMDQNMDQVKAWWNKDLYGYYSNGDQDVMTYLLVNKYKGKYILDNYNEFNSRVDDLVKGNVFLVHFTGKMKKKHSDLRKAMGLLNRDKSLIDNRYREVVNAPFKKTFLKRFVNYFTKKIYDKVFRKM